MEGASPLQAHTLNKGLRWMNNPAQVLPLTDAVLRLIWQEHQISRADIARRLKLSRSTVTEIVKELLQTSFVNEVGRGSSSGGRRPRMLEFQDEARCILGVDIGSSHVSVVLTDLRCRLIKWKTADHPVSIDPEGTRALVIKLCDECLASYGARNIPLLSIGVSVPSPVDPTHPERIPEVVLPAWKGQSGIEHLRKKYGVPVFVDNDANLGALGEQWWGAASGVDNMIFVKLGGGIGAGYILNGELYRGAEGIAGELGHLPINSHGPTCVCGLKGCLVTYLGSYALKARARVLLAKQSERERYKQKHMEGQPKHKLVDHDVTIAAIKKAAVAGDKVALQVVHEAAEHLGVALTGLINIINPRMVVVGGGMSALGDLFMVPLREKVKRSTLVSLAAGVRVQASVLGAKVIALGASTLALEVAFSAPNIIERANEPAAF